MIASRKNLKKVSEAFFSGTFFSPVVGAEIEFYFLGEGQEKRRHRERSVAIQGLHSQDVPCSPWTATPAARNDDDMEAEILAFITSQCADLDPLDIKKESGHGQYEISLRHSPDCLALADRIMQFRTRMATHANFSAKPFAEDYGSALHIHISLLDRAGRNVFMKDGEEESALTRYAIGGLLATMAENMPHFAPYEACYARLSGGKDAPATVSWGGNNRTVALRLPTTTTDPQNRRIEHRVAAADADPYAVIAAILEGVALGISERILPQSGKIYGDASLALYGLPELV